LDQVKRGNGSGRLIYAKRGTTGTRRDDGWEATTFQPDGHPSTLVIQHKSVPLSLSLWRVNEPASCAVVLPESRHGYAVPEPASADGSLLDAFQATPRRRL